MANTIQQKLQLKPGGDIVLLNAPSELAERLSDELQGAEVTGESAGEAAAVLVFVNSLDETSRLVPEGIRAVKASRTPDRPGRDLVSPALSPGRTGREVNHV